MGIKGWLAIGGVILTGVAVWLGLKKKEDEHYEKIQKMIRDVDRKEPENKEEPTEKIIDDIEKGFRDMGLNEEADAYVEATKAVTDICEGIAAELGTTAKDLEAKGKSEMDKLKGKSMDEILKMQEEFDKQHPYRIVRKGVEVPATKEEWEAEQKFDTLDAINAQTKELEKIHRDMVNVNQTADETIAVAEETLKTATEMLDKEYKRKVKKAVEQKNWTKLEELFDRKYANGPYSPSPASVFGEAHNHGDISEDIYEMAADYYGKLWNYSGD